MVNSSYMLKKPPPPSAPKVWLDQRVMPALIDAFAAVETRIERVSVCTKRSPFAGLAAALGIGWLLAGARTPTRRPRRRA